MMMEFVEVNKSQPILWDVGKCSVLSSFVSKFCWLPKIVQEWKPFHLYTMSSKLYY